MDELICYFLNCEWIWTDQSVTPITPPSYVTTNPLIINPTSVLDAVQHNSSMTIAFVASSIEYIRIAWPITDERLDKKSVKGITQVRFGLALEECITRLLWTRYFPLSQLVNPYTRYSYIIESLNRSSILNHHLLNIRTAHGI